MYIRLYLQPRLHEECNILIVRGLYFSVRKFEQKTMHLYDNWFPIRLSNALFKKCLFALKTSQIVLNNCSNKQRLKLIDFDFVFLKILILNKR